MEQPSLETYEHQLEVQNANLRRALEALRDVFVARIRCIKGDEQIVQDITTLLSSNAPAPF